MRLQGNDAIDMIAFECMYNKEFLSMQGHRRDTWSSLQEDGMMVEGDRRIASAQYIDVEPEWIRLSHGQVFDMPPVALNMSNIPLAVSQADIGLLLCVRRRDRHTRRRHEVGVTYQSATAAIQSSASPSRKKDPGSFVA